MEFLRHPNLRSGHATPGSITKQVLRSYAAASYTSSSYFLANTAMFHFIFRSASSWLSHRWPHLRSAIRFFKTRGAADLVFPLQGLNFLPYRHTRVLRCRAWRRRELALAAGFGLVVASLLQYYQSNQVNRAVQNEKNLQQKLANWQPQLTESQRLNASIAAHQRRLTALNNLLPEQLALITLLNQLGRLHQASVTITQLKMGSGTSTLSGIAHDYGALSGWVQALQKTGKFANVEVAQVQQRTSLPSSRAEAQHLTSVGLAFSVNLNSATAAPLPLSRTATTRSITSSKTSNTSLRLRTAQRIGWSEARTSTCCSWSSGRI